MNTECLLYQVETYTMRKEDSLERAALHERQGDHDSARYWFIRAMFEEKQEKRMMRFIKYGC